MKLYLSGPMRGIPHNNREAFKDARERLRDMGHDVFCPSEFSDLLNAKKVDSDIRRLMEYDAVYICKHAEGIACLPGWTKSKGSMAEVHLAWAIGIPVYEYEMFVRRVIREIKGVPGNHS